MTIPELADHIHGICCDEPGTGRPCAGYQPGNRHHDWYRDRAQAIHDKLTPLISAASIPAVTQIIMEELC